MKLRNRKKYFVLFLFALLVKLLSASYLLYLTNHQSASNSSNPFSVLTAQYPIAEDTVDPMENFVTKGTYYRWNGSEMVYAGRMPHYSLIYCFFRFFFSKQLTCFSISLFQIIIESVSIIFLCMLAELVFQSKIAFYWVYMIQLISLNTSASNLWIDPLSLSESFLVISIYFLYKYLEEENIKILIISGICFGYVVTLRPYIGMFYGVFFLQLLINYRHSTGIKRLISVGKLSLIYFMPFLLLVTPWIIRNYSIYHRFIPMQINLTAGEYFPNSHFAYRKYISALGESFQSWDKRSAGSYFEPRYKTGSEYVFPSYVFTKNYTMKEIEDVKNKFANVFETRNDSLDKLVEGKFIEMRDEFISEHPIRFYLLSPVKRLKIFLFHSGSYYLPINKEFPSYKPYQMLIKISQSLLYYFTLLFGFSGLVALAFLNKNNLLLLSIPVVLIVFFVLILQDIGFQYFDHSYPFMCVGSFCSTLFILKKRQDKTQT